MLILSCILGVDPTATFAIGSNTLAQTTESINYSTIIVVISAPV